MNPALVSVYIPTRNRAQLVSRAITSVLNQTYRNVELLVVDDASEDDTADTVRRLITASAGRTEISYIRLERKSGACAARNLAIAAAKGKYITGLDDDDYFAPDRIARLVDAFDRSPGAFVFDGYIRETTSAGGKIRQTHVPLRKPAQLDDLLRRNIVGNQVLTLTSRLRDVGGFDESLPAWQDYDLWIRLVKAFGKGNPAGGYSYVHTVDATRERISGDNEKIERAFAIFLAKHADYADRKARLCLRLAKVCYGINDLSIGDLPGLMRLGEPRYLLFALYSYLANRQSRTSSR